MWYKLIYKIGVKLRNPSLTGWYQFLKQSETWNLTQLEEYQLKKLKVLLVYATKHSTFYKKFYTKNTISIDAIKSLSDLQKLPLLTKETVLKNSKQIQVVPPNTKLFNASTSGSTGESLKFKRDESADSFNRASQLRGYSWYNVKPWEKNGYFWGYNFSLLETLKTKFLDFLQHRFRLFSYTNKNVNLFLNNLQTASYMEGYSSMIFELAKKVNTNTTAYNFNLKLVKGTSEKIFDSYKTEIKKAFNVNFTSEYGAAESGIIAFECKQGNMHINMEGVIVEEIDSEIVVTNLQMKSFPIIRYKLGDYIKLAPTKVRCKCGLNHRIIETVNGRVGEKVFGKKHTYPSLYFYYIFKNISKKYNLHLTYQVKQLKKGVLIFNIEDVLNPEEHTILSNEVIKHFDNDVLFEINDNATLERKKNKLISFISTVE